MRFKNLEGKPERESPRRTISSNGELGLLQMVLESDTGRCASEDAVPPKGVDCKIPHRWRGERSIPYKGVETFS